jgi:hypothetical protein
VCVRLTERIFTGHGAGIRAENGSRVSLGAFATTLSHSATATV